MASRLFSVVRLRKCIYVYIYISLNLYQFLIPIHFRVLSNFASFHVLPSLMVTNLALSSLFAQSVFLFAQCKQSPSHVGCLLCWTATYTISSFLGTSGHNVSVLLRSFFLSIWVFSVLGVGWACCQITSMQLTTLPPPPASLPLCQGGKRTKRKRRWRGAELKENGRFSLMLKISIWPTPLPFSWFWIGEGKEVFLLTPSLLCMQNSNNGI